MLFILQHIKRHFVEGFERLLGVWPKRLHAIVFITDDCLWAHFEVELVFMDDAEEGGSMIETVAAEHGSAGQTAKINKLIQYEVPEAVMLGWHES